LTAISACAVLLSVTLWLGTPMASGQRPSPVAGELSEVLSRAGPAERVPVIVQVGRLDPPRPLAPDRDFRAAEHASNLSSLYVASIERLRATLPADLALDVQAGEVLWISGAIAVELTPAQVRSLEGRSDVQRIYYDGLVQVDLAASDIESPPLLWAPGLPVAAQDPAGGLPWGLVEIGAPDLWAAGATGQGTIIAIIDSGVDGTHPLLWRRWRGASASAREAWFDPWGISAVPVDDDNTGGVGHGTTVATVTVGSLEPGDTLIFFGQPQIVEDELEVVTGVAPGAEWVAANGFEVFGGATYTRRSILLQSMQWVLDPDGDPATVSDVPDVLNNSWGYPPGGCDGLFDRAIDALEFAGVPVVFSAGNLSSGFETVASPGERADLLLNSFAVGAAEQSNGQIVVAENSLGGPSPCAPGAVKPEVVAPGVIPLVRNLGLHTAQVGGRTGPFTSWSAPHVTGALAVLSGLNPGASANDLKGALFSTADDLPPPGLDNRSGAGFIDLAAAAGRIGGLGGVQLSVSDWTWDSAGGSLYLELFNGGADPFPGGTAELLSRFDGKRLAMVAAPPIVPRRSGTLRFADLPAGLAAGDRLSLRLDSDGAILELPLSLAASSATSVTLEDGAIRFSLDARGRLGRVADAPGFEFLGNDWLAGGALLFVRGDGVSDGAYVDVLQQPPLKSNPVGSDTDWGDVRMSALGTSAELEFNDERALRPLGASVGQTVDLVAVGDSAAFAVLKTVINFSSSADVSLAGLLLDWDFDGRDSVSWDSELGASVMVPADSTGPWLALTAVPRPPVTHAAVPLGTPVGGFYVVDSSSGVLSKPEGFTDTEKALYMRLGSPGSSDSSVADWAQLVTVGPLRQDESNSFLIAAGQTRAALQAALDSARIYADEGVDDDPVTPLSGALELLPAYPNPFDPIADGGINLPFLVNRGSEPVQATLEIYTISGRLVYSEQRDLTPDSPVEPFRWSGALGNGEAAASGVYGYVISVGRLRQFAKFVVLK
jgi:bacillopeptidase F